MLDFASFPRAELCHQPTPIERMPRLEAQLGGPALWVKRDDCTGLAGGGNKTRKLEFLVGEALAQGCDMLVTQGAIQSNHVRQTAAAARKFGLDCHAVLEKRVPNTDHAYEQSGNVLLDRMFAMTMEYREGGLDMNAETEQVVERLRGTGRRPYFIPGGGSNVTGALGYAVCAQEIVTQSAALGVKFDWVVSATGSTGTQAGLVAGLEALQSGIPVMGVSVRQSREKQRQAVHGLAQKTASTLGHDGLGLDTIHVDDGYVGEGYGIPAESTLEALWVAAQTEGLLLDPVYSGKGFAGLLGLIRAGQFHKEQKILFLHTGGAVALFAYESILNN